MEKTMNEITDDVMGCKLSEYGIDHVFHISKRDLQNMLEEMYDEGRCSAFQEAQ